MVELFVHPLVGAVCLIVFHIQAVMDSPDHCAWQLGLQVVSSQNLSQEPFFDLLGTHICMPLLYYHCNVGLELRPICNVGLEPRPISFDFWFIIPHLILTPCHHPLRAGGLFHFKTDHACLPFDSRNANRPTDASDKGFRLLNWTYRSAQ
jgi:hypothetical protein